MDAAFWVPLALIAALTQAAMPLTSERFKIVPTTNLLVLTRLFAFIFLLPLALTVDWPTSPLFYFCTISAAVIIMFTDILLFRTAAQNGAGVTTRIEPLAAFTTFMLWTAITPALLADYIDTPLRSLGIIAAIGGAAFFAVRLYHCPISRQALKKLLPVVLLGAVIIVFSKTAMNHSDSNGPFLYAFLQACIIGPGYLLLMKLKPERYPPLKHSKTVWLSGFVMAIASTIHIVSKQSAIQLVENPAYVLVIGLTAPLWVLAFYRMIKHEERGDILSGLGIVACAALLVICTQF